MALTSSLTRVLFIAAIALAAVADVEATANKPRPAHYKIRTSLSKVGDETEAVSKRATSGRINGAYYPNWCVMSPWCHLRLVLKVFLWKGCRHSQCVLHVLASE